MGHHPRVKARGPSLGAEAFTTQDVLTLYRLRWRVDPRITVRGLIGLKGPPGMDERSAKPWLLAHLLMILLLEPLVDEFEDSPHWGLAARPAPAHGVCCSSLSPHSSKPSSRNRQSPVCDAARRRCGDISTSRLEGATIRKWPAYFSAYGITVRGSSGCGASCTSM